MAHSEAAAHRAGDMLLSYSPMGNPIAYAPVIHQCSHPNDEDPHFRITEEKIFKDIFHYIEVNLGSILGEFHDQGDVKGTVIRGAVMGS
jgi:hypothetical protein